MFDRRHLALCSILVLAAAGCGGEPGDEPITELGSASDEIKGGYLDPNDVNVVGIYDNAIGGICSGSLIAPNLVLTAHHCVANIYNEVNGGVDCNKTSFGPPHKAYNFYVTTKGSLNSQNPADYHTVKEVLVTPTDAKLCGQDQAILILSKPVDPAEATPLVPRVDSPLAPGEQYYAIGFGATNDAGSGAGVRRRRDNLFVDCVDLACPSWKGAKANEWVGDTGICGGDSGGPALDMVGRVVGVTSRGLAGCESPVYGSVAGWGQWIKDAAVHAAEVGGYAPPPWATGYPTDPAFSQPVGDPCSAADQCASNWCIGDPNDLYCTRPCNDAAPCPSPYTCDAGMQACVAPPADVPKKKKSNSATEEAGGCSVAGPELDADPTKPIPWFIGVGALGALALLRRRNTKRS